jgi:ribonuclease Z
LEFEVTILGTGSATPAAGRNPSAQVLMHHQRLFLIDCGEGAQMQMRRFHVRSSKINHIFISHLHGDHYLGLPGFLASLHLKNRTVELHLYCHRPLKEILELQFRYSQTHIRFPIVYHFLNPEEQECIYEDDGLEVISFPLNHRIDCNGFLFREKPKLFPVKKEMLAFFKIHPQDIPSIKRGEDYISPEGEVISNNRITLPRPPSAAYAYCSDTIYLPKLKEILAGVDLLYHEATFLNDMKSRAKETYHTTAGEAAALAESAGVKKLLLGHFSARYHHLQDFETEARAVFPNAVVAEEGKTYQVHLLP